MLSSYCHIYLTIICLHHACTWFPFSRSQIHNLKRNVNRCVITTGARSAKELLTIADVANCLGFEDIMDKELEKIITVGALK